jgi:hypothetical protein
MSDPVKTFTAVSDPAQAGDPGVRRAPSPKARMAAERGPVKKFSTGMEPDKHGLHHLDPVLTRKGATAHKGVLFMAAAGILVLAYAFNVGGLQVYLDQFFTNVDKSAQSQNSAVVSTIITIAPYVGAALLGLILYGIARWMFSGVKSMSKGRRLAKRQEVTLSQFVKLAGEREIGAKVAREAYGLLLPHYHGQMRVRLNDRLTDDLHLDHHDTVDLWAGLLRKSDRVFKSVEELVQPETVLELMQMVEKAPVRAAAVEPPRPKTGVRQLSFIRPISKQAIAEAEKRSGGQTM